MNKVKKIAFYLPQYHRIPENDKWWGEGFTEWTNVRKAKPLFAGHDQPHVPHEDIGYYDLSDPSISIKQSQIAKNYGLDGFCYYYYWFNGKKLLDTPINNMLKSKEIDTPFCICWANENWTRTWDGQEKDILMPQDHSPRYDVEFMNDITDILKDPRYITIDGKPLLVIYRTSLFPNIKETAQRWRDIAKERGLKGIYLVRVEGLEEAVDPAEIGFDAAIEFAPDWRYAVIAEGDNKEIAQNHIQKRYGIDKAEPILRDYELTLNRMISGSEKPYKYFRGVFPSWDNTARKGGRGTVFVGSNSDKFKYFLDKQIANTENNKSLSEDERLIFINAWNEWGEGCHLEPDIKNGYANLEALTGPPRDKHFAAAYERELSRLYTESYLRELRARYENTKEIKELMHINKDKDGVIERNQEAITYLKHELDAIVNSRAWRLVQYYYKSAHQVKGALRPFVSKLRSKSQSIRK